MPLSRSHTLAISAVVAALVVATIGFALVPGVMPWMSAPEDALDPADPDDSGNGGDGTPDDGSGTGVAGNTPPPEGSYSVHLTVRTDAGPIGPEPLPLHDRPIGTNIWYSSGWWPQVDEEWRTLLAGMQPGYLRWPAGHPSQNYCFEPVAGAPTPGCDARDRVTGEQLKAFAELAESVGAEPVIGVNVKRGSPAMAAEMVRYANVENDLDITWWYIGNEPDIGGDTSRLPAHNVKHAEITAAMRAVDPDIKFVAPEMMTGVDTMGIHGRMDWMRPFLEKNGGTVDAVSWHLYPLDSENHDPNSPAYATKENLLQWQAPSWRQSGLSFISDIGSKVRADRDEFSPGAEIWVTEIGPDSGAPGAPGVTDAHVAAIWFAEVTGRLIEQDTDVVLQFAFDHWTEGVDELSVIREDPDGDGWATLPPYDALYLMSHALGDEMVNATSSDEPDVGVYASRHADGRVSVIMVNKGNATVDARLTVDGMGEAERANAWVLTGEELSSLTDTRINGERLTADRIANGGIPAEDVDPDADGLRTLPPYSVTVIEFTPADT